MSLGCAILQWNGQRKIGSRHGLYHAFTQINAHSAHHHQSHIICEPAAAQVIKTYDPVLMVHPYMRSSKHINETDTIDSVSATVTAMLSRLHVVVIGPGLGRDEAMLETCARVITEA